MQGRRGRQITRALGVVNYLRAGEGRIFGFGLPFVQVEHQTEIVYMYDSIQKVVETALNFGIAMERGSDDNVFIALAATSGAVDEKEMAATIGAAVDGMREPFYRFVSEAIWSPNPLVPPVPAWPLADPTLLALLEGDVVLVHVADLGALFELSYEGGKIVLDDREGATVVTADKHRFPLTPNWPERILLGFATVESVGLAAIEGATATPSRLIPVGDPRALPAATGRPEVRSVTSLEALKDIVPEDVGKVLVMPGSVFSHIDLSNVEDSYPRVALYFGDAQEPVMDEPDTNS
jgi:hypothetical protein